MNDTEFTAEQRQQAIDYLLDFDSRMPISADHPFKRIADKIKNGQDFDEADEQMLFKFNNARIYLHRVGFFK